VKLPTPWHWNFDIYEVSYSVRVDNREIVVVVSFLTFIWKIKLATKQMMASARKAAMAACNCFRFIK
jgi:hypothetical protein